MKKQTILVTLVIIMTVLLAACVQESVKDTIKVGAILPLTGEGTPDQGQASQKAIMLKIDEINANGGINGKKVEAVFEDSQCQAQKGVTAIRKLIDMDKADFIIGDICDSVTAAIIPIAESNKLILITPGSTSPAISEGGDYIFRFWFSEDDLGGMVAEKAYASGKRNIAILYINNAWGVAQKEGVRKRFEQLGGKIVSEQAIDPDNVDYRTEILKAENQNPDAYYIGLHPNGLALAMKQLKEQQISKQVYSHGGLVGSTQTLGLGGEDLEGIIAPFVYNPDNAFVEKFKAKYHSEPGITADSSYDAVTAVLKIIDEKGPDSETIKNGLYALSGYQGASGSITVDVKGDVHRPLQMLLVREGRLVPMDD